MSIQSLQSFWQDEEAASAVEYGLMVALIAAIIVSSVTGIGQKLLNAFNKVLTALPST